MSFVTASIKMHYRVVNLHSYLYKKANPQDFITDITYREVVKFLGSIDIFDLLKEKRLALANHLKGNVEAVLSAADIGVEVLHLGFESAHPPVEVGEAYQSLIKALEESHTAVLKAETYTNEIEHRAKAEAYEIKQKARAYKARRTGIAAAEAKRFSMVKEAYNVSPNVFFLRKYMSALEDGTENIRLYIIPSNSKVGSNKIINLEDKLQFGVEDIDFGAEE